MSQSAVDFMAQPSTHFEPRDPMPLRTVTLNADEFNRLATQVRKPIEPLEDGWAQLVIGAVRYVAQADEACS